MSRVGIVIIAAILVEVISIIQYQQLRKLMQEEMEGRSSLLVRSISDAIENTLSLTESTMRENLWDVKRCMAHPDSLFDSMRRLIDDNPHVVGGCLACIPDYYPSKGRLFEPYASKDKDGNITTEQLGGPDHDYTLNKEYQWVLDNHASNWTDPYLYGPDSLSYATYSYPVTNDRDEIIAVCGLDIDLSWLGDMLNAHQPYPSSFAVLLTQDGEFVAGPSTSSHITQSQIDQAVAIFNGQLPASANRSITLQKTSLEQAPYWRVLEVFKTEEVFAGMRRLRLQHMFLVFLALAILAFVINRFARNDNKLRVASEERARIAGELTVAHRIQQEMLPKSFPPFAFGTLEPAREVGGDLFDFVIRDGKFFFCVGDVSGKGVPSSMFMAMAHSMFHLITHREERPGRILKAMNSTLCQGNDSNMFITMFLGVLDLYSGEFFYSSAGHDKPFILTEKAFMLLAKSNLPLGVFPNTSFEEQHMTLDPGTIILLYTDGLTEAKNLERKTFGRERMAQVFRSFYTSADNLLQNLVNSLSIAAHLFAGEAPQSDDLTLLAVRFAPENLIREQITLRNEVSEVTRLSAFIKDFFGKIEIDRKVAAGLRLALEEVVVNVIDYAYPEGEAGDVLVMADTNRQEIRFTIVDSGYPFDPTSVLEPDTTLDAQKRPIGGLGILLSRKLTDSISYTRRDGKNVLSLTKTI